VPLTLAFDLSRSDLQIVRLYEILCKDGTIARLTDADHDVTIATGPVTYEARLSTSFSRITKSDDGRGNVCEITTTLSSGGAFDPAKVALGRFKNSVCTVRLCDLSDLSVSSWDFAGVAGDQTYSEDATGFKIEFRSDISLARSVVVDNYSGTCRAKFGDYVNPSSPGRCQMPVRPDDVIRNTAYAVGDFYRVRSGTAGTPADYANRLYKVTTAGTTAALQPSYDTTVGHSTIDGGVTAIAMEAWLRTVTVASVSANGHDFVISDPADARVVGDSFAMGWVAVNGNYDLELDVRAYDAGSRTVSLWMPVAALLQVGDILDISPGCFKRREEDCADRFANAENFQGEG